MSQQRWRRLQEKSGGAVRGRGSGRGCCARSAAVEAAPAGEDARVLSRVSGNEYRCRSQLELGPRERVDAATSDHRCRAVGLYRHRARKILRLQRDWPRSTTTTSAAARRCRWCQRTMERRPALQGGTRRRPRLMRQRSTTIDGEVSLAWLLEPSRSRPTSTKSGARTTTTLTQRPLLRCPLTWTLNE